MSSKTSIPTAGGELGTACPSQRLRLFRGCDDRRDNASDESNEARQLAASLVSAFADATGWELGLIGEEVKIVDMNPSWPANTPTVHRGRCDRLAEEISRLFSAQLTPSDRHPNAGAKQTSTSLQPTRR